MKIEDKVCSLEQSKTLKRLGVSQDTEWFWVYPENDGMISTTYGVYHKSVAHGFIEDNEGNEFDSAISSAYDVAELGEIIPDKYYLPSKKEDGKWWASHSLTFEDTEAQARAAMLIILISQKDIKAV